MGLKTAVCIKDSIVVNTALYDEDTSQSWLELEQNNYDKILIVDLYQASIGWEEYEPNKVRPQKPMYDVLWDEETQQWVSQQLIEEQVAE